jgi:hypothetical protein
MGDTGSLTGVAVFLGLSPMAVAMVLNFFEAEGLPPWERGSGLSEEDGVERTEERDHRDHRREEEGAGAIDMDREGVNK